MDVQRWSTTCARTSLPRAGSSMGLWVLGGHRTTSEEVHAYRSAIMSVPEARRAQRLVLRYYRQALDDWIILGKNKRNLPSKTPIRRTTRHPGRLESVGCGGVSCRGAGDRCDLLFRRLLVQLEPCLTSRRPPCERIGRSHAASDLSAASSAPSPQEVRTRPPTPSRPPAGRSAARRSATLWVADPFGRFEVGQQ
jgi:hypothetical protein